MDTLSNESGIKWEITPGKALLVAFAGQAKRLYEFEHFEFVKSTAHADCSKIYCLDPNLNWYQSGINAELNSIPKMSAYLQELLNLAQPTHVRFIGVSAGGFAALLFGHLLKADSVLAFGCQTFLIPELEEQYRVPGMEEYDTKGKSIPSGGEYILDLYPLLSTWNGKTIYTLHVGEGCLKDRIYAEHLKACPNVQIKYYSCNTHACASQLLQAQGKLSEVVLAGLY